MPLTPNRGYPYPARTDMPRHGWRDIQNLAQAVDLDVAGIAASIGAGYRFLTRIYYTANGTFTKANYPGIRAVLVQVKGGGGGSAGAVATGTGQASVGGGGGEGGYSSKWIDALNLNATETVIVGAGGRSEERRVGKEWR